MSKGTQENRNPQLTFGHASSSPSCLLQYKYQILLKERGLEEILPTVFYYHNLKAKNNFSILAKQTNKQTQKNAL